MERLNLENVIVCNLEGLAKSIETDDGKILLDSNYIEEILKKTGTNVLFFFISKYCVF